jgi:hypothetical protein
MIGGRVVEVDADRDGGDPLRNLGSLIALASDHPWARMTASFKDVADANGEMRSALFPVMRTSSLARLGDLTTRSLCAAGLAGAIWSPGDEAPRHEICKILEEQKRPIIASTALPWRDLVAREPDLRLVLRWDRTWTNIPERPDSTARSRVILVIPVAAEERASLLDEAIDGWGATHVHLDLTGLMGAGAPDSASLCVIRRLLDSAWSNPKIEGVLGRNLGGF